MNTKLLRMISGTAAAAAMVAVMGASSGATALAASTPVTVPYLLAVNTTTGLYNVPDLNAYYVGQVTAGQNWFGLGEDSTGQWLEIQVGPGIVAWGASSAFTLNGITLPVIDGFTGSTAVVTPISATTVPANSPVIVAAGSSILVGVTVTSNIYNLPNAYVVGQVTAGQTWFAIGRDSTGKWTQLQIDPTNSAWVLTSALGLGSTQLPMVAGVTGS